MNTLLALARTLVIAASVVFLLPPGTLVQSAEACAYCRFIDATHAACTGMLPPGTFCDPVGANGCLTYGTCC